MISAGIRTSKAWISLMALSPLAAGAPSPDPRRVAVRSGNVALGLACESHAAVACGQGATRLFCFAPWLDGSTAREIFARCTPVQPLFGLWRGPQGRWRQCLRAAEGLLIKSAVGFIAPMIAR